MNHPFSILFLVIVIISSCTSTQKVTSPPTMPPSSAPPQPSEVIEVEEEIEVKEVLSLPTNKLGGGSSGMAQVDPTTYLAVYDLKIFQDGPRMGLIRTYPDRIEVDAIDLRDKEGELVKTSDLEAIAKIPDVNNEYLMIESGNWQGNGGNIYHVKLNVEKLSATLIGKAQLPMLAKNDRGVYGDQNEGLACLKKEGDNIHLLMAERGGSAAYPNGKIKWGTYNTADQSLYFTSEGQEGIEVNAPGEWPDAKTNRDITDLRIDKQGRVWAAASQDQGDAGPFVSIIYELGKLTGGTSRPIKVHSQLEVWESVPGFKIEALSGASLVAPGSKISFGTEDEFYGGVWRAI